MSKRRIHRVSVYLLDQERKRVLLHLCKDGPHAKMYVPFSATLNGYQTPVETAKQAVTDASSLGFCFLTHNPAMPLVLDEHSAKIHAPLHVQVTRVSTDEDWVDYVYLGQADTTPEYKDGGPLVWFNQNNIKQSPTHVRHIVHYILALMN